MFADLRRKDSTMLQNKIPKLQRYTYAKNTAYFQSSPVSDCDTSRQMSISNSTNTLIHVRLFYPSKIISKDKKERSPHVVFISSVTTRNVYSANLVYLVESHLRTRALPLLLTLLSVTMIQTILFTNH